MSQPEFDICVIGGGAGGLVVAAGGASLGAKVALVEKHALGGDCLHYGCVPSKTLLHSAKVAHTMRQGRRYGLQSHHPAIKIGDVMQHVSDVIKTIEVNDSPERFRGMGVDVVFGDGGFTDRNTFHVDGRDITAKRFVIATGSSALIPAIDGIEDVPYLTNETVFSLNEPVPRLIVLGAGPIGLEMAQAFARLGSQVHVIQRPGHALPRDDTDLSEVVTRQLQQEGVEFHFNSSATGITGQARNIQLTVKDNNGTESTLNGTHLLIATGRRANIHTLNLEAAGVEVQDGRRIVTDQRLRTTNPSIYACGDVVGPYLFTHMAEHHAGVILRNTIFRLPAKVEQRAIPWCTFTDPELARVGLSETEATKQRINHKVYTFPFHDVDRAQTEGETTGFAKIITGRRGRLLGAALVGPHAGELIHEYALALAHGMKASDLSRVIHIYPTLAQINRRVADARMKEGLTPTAKKWIKWLFRLRGPQ